jgi:hypothetical protein
VHVEYEQPPVVAQLASPLTLGPFASRADTYNGASPAASTDELAAALFERLHPTLHDESLRDPRLDAVAAALSTLEGDAVVTRSALGFALYDHGVPEPVIGFATAQGDDLARLAEELARQIEPLRRYGPAAVGIGHVAGHGAVVVLTRAPMFWLHPLRRHLAHGASVALVGALEPGLRAPTLTVTHDDGPPERVPLARLGTGYALRFTCVRGPGTRWLTIEALDGANIAQRLVSAPIDCDDEPDRIYRVEPTADLRGNDPARVLEAIVNRERIADGLAPLRGDLRLRATAAQLAAGSIPKRADAQLLPMRDGAATFAADTLADAVEVLLDRASMREMLRRREFTHVGIATRPARGGGLRISIQLAKIPEAIDTRTATAQVMAELQRAAAPRDLAPSRQLTKLATWYAIQLARGWDPSSFGDHMQTQLSTMAFRTPKVVVRTVARIADLDLSDVVPPHEEYLGLAVVQAPRNGALAGRIFVVMLFAR